MGIDNLSPYRYNEYIKGRSQLTVALPRSDKMTVEFAVQAVILFTLTLDNQCNYRYKERERLNQVRIRKLHYATPFPVFVPGYYLGRANRQPYLAALKAFSYVP